MNFENLAQPVPPRNEQQASAANIQRNDGENVHEIDTIGHAEGQIVRGGGGRRRARNNGTGGRRTGRGIYTPLKLLHFYLFVNL